MSWGICATLFVSDEASMEVTSVAGALHSRNVPQLSAGQCWEPVCAQGGVQALNTCVALECCSDKLSCCSRFDW